MSTYQTLGIILNKTDRGESDQLFSLYTKDRGKVLALGRGTKKPKSKLNYQLKELAVLQLMIAPGKNHSHVAGVVCLGIFSQIFKDLKKIILASFALELLDKLTKFEQKDEKIFVLLLKYLTILNNNSFTDAEWQVVRQAFTVKLLTLLGFRPPADVVASQKQLENFLKNEFDLVLETEKFMIKMKA